MAGAPCKLTTAKKDEDAFVVTERLAFVLETRLGNRPPGICVAEFVAHI